MTNLNQRLRVEIENIDDSLKTLPASRSCNDLSEIELAGVGALLLNFYNGVEKMLKDVLKSQGFSLSKGPSWHRDLLLLAVDRAVLSETTAQALHPYMAFRHFFIHSYVVHLEAKSLDPLLRQVDGVYEKVKRDLDKFIKG